ncbi:MAG: cytochrome c [Gemmatimonadota bacterium]|nr:cytochrome c [Gemmatimonadota bacterium]
MASARRLALAAALALATTGCDYYYNDIPSPDELWYIVPWFDHMLGSPAIDPYETAAVPRNTIPGTVPVSGAEASWEAEWTTGNFAAADQLVNPLAGGGQTLASPEGVEVTGRGTVPTMTDPGPAVAVIPATVEARGDTLYQTFCAVCHGTTGAGDGPVAPRVGAPSIVTPRAAGYSDGYLYSIIRYGRGVMPRYGDKIYAPLDRWAVVNHVRRLQGAFSTPTEPAPTAGQPAGTPPAGGTPAAGGAR